MIHKSSKDPVLVKKISLKGWKLSEELKAEIKSRLDAKEDEEKIVAELEKVFTPPKKANLKLVEAESENSATEESSETVASKENKNEEDEDAHETIKVLQNVPQLSAEQLFSGRTFLSEITMENIHFFCTETFLEGQSIVLQFLIPKPFIMNMEVISSRAYALNSRIISEGKLPYRVIAKFTYIKPGERALLRDFLSSIEAKSHDQSKSHIKPKAPNELNADNSNASIADLAGIADLDL